jgi:hypothetical protein
MPAAIDVTVTSPLQPSFLIRTAEAGGVAAKAAEEAKAEKHNAVALSTVSCFCHALSSVQMVMAPLLRD